MEGHEKMMCGGGGGGGGVERRDEGRVLVVAVVTLIQLIQYPSTCFSRDQTFYQVAITIIEYCTIAWR